MEHEAHIILSLPLCDFSYEGKLIWAYNNDGLFSIKSGYQLAEELTEMQVKGNFDAECSDRLIKATVVDKNLVFGCS